MKHKKVKYTTLTIKYGLKMNVCLIFLHLIASMTVVIENEILKQIIRTLLVTIFVNQFSFVILVATFSPSLQDETIFLEFEKIIVKGSFVSSPNNG